ncbi:hypothetical protein PSTT_03861, partial [Puccinia striiformis]
GGYLSITLVALFVFLHSGQAIATTQTCDAYFGPSNDPRRDYCSSDGTRYSCGVNSCKAADRPWSSVYFQNCYLIVNKYTQYNITITGGPKSGQQARLYFVDAQDIHDRKWYSCSYTRDVPDDLNAQRPS